MWENKGYNEDYEAPSSDLKVEENCWLNRTYVLDATTEYTFYYPLLLLFFPFLFLLKSILFDVLIFIFYLIGNLVTMDGDEAILIIQHLI